MAKREADWAALVPWRGIQNLPTPVNGVAIADAPQTTVVVPLAKLTPGGTAGSLTIVNGLVTATAAPT